MRLRGISLVLLCLITVTAFGYWRYKVAGASQAVAQFVFIQDPSDSILSDCSRITGFAERALAMPQTGSGSTITFFSMGNEATANEPQLLDEFKIPVIRRVIEGQRAAAREKGELLTNLKNRCEEVKQTRVSPIFQALQRGVEHLQSVGSVADSRYLFIQTDGEETVNLQIKQALDKPLSAKFRLPSPIQNKGVNITFCGMAETVGTMIDNGNKAHHKSKQRDPERTERLREVWSMVFTNPELVSFEPYCSRAGAPSSK